MAEIKYIDYSCDLKFGDNTFELPLNEQTAELIEKTFNDSLIKQELKGIDDINRFYNQLMDGIDKVLGDGAAEKIMARFAHPGVMEIMSVINYITAEWKKQYESVVEEMKKTADLPNRTTRRAARH